LFVNIFVGGAICDDGDDREDKIVPLPDGEYEMVTEYQKDDGLGTVEVWNKAEVRDIGRNGIKQKDAAQVKKPTMDDTNSEKYDYKIPMITKSNIIAQPWAVMVKPSHTLITRTTVFGAQRFSDHATDTILRRFTHLYTIQNLLRGNGIFC